MVVTGSECTGKTTLARELAEHYGTIWVPEYARTCVERATGPLTSADVEPIARGQLAAQDEAIRGSVAHLRGAEDVGGAHLGFRMPGRAPETRGQLSDVAPRLVFFDTDLLSTALYARHYYGDCPGWIDAAAFERVGDLYLLLHPDVPWVADGIARDRGHMRDHMHGLFREALKACGARTVDIRGGWDARRALARRAIDPLVR